MSYLSMGQAEITKRQSMKLVEKIIAEQQDKFRQIWNKYLNDDEEKLSPAAIYNIVESEIIEHLRDYTENLPRRLCMAEEIMRRLFDNEQQKE